MVVRMSFQKILFNLQIIFLLLPSRYLARLLNARPIKNWMYFRSGSNDFFKSKYVIQGCFRNGTTERRNFLRTKWPEYRKQANGTKGTYGKLFTERVPEFRITKNFFSRIWQTYFQHSGRLVRVIHKRILGGCGQENWAVQHRAGFFISVEITVFSRLKLKITGFRGFQWTEINKTTPTDHQYMIPVDNSYIDNGQWNFRRRVQYDHTWWLIKESNYTNLYLRLGIFYRGV